MASKKSKNSMQVDTLHTISNDQATDGEITLPKKNKGGRPPKNPKAKLQIGPTRLSSNRPVQHPPTADTWCLIFKFSDPNLLINLIDGQGEWAQDMTSNSRSSIFQEVLTNSSIWKEARLNKYGDDHPNPPPGLSEYQYAKLFRKVGCQSKGCQNKHARTIYWAFLQRWCGKCLIGNTVEVRKSSIMRFQGKANIVCIRRAQPIHSLRHIHYSENVLQKRRLTAGQGMHMPETRH